MLNSHSTLDILQHEYKEADIHPKHKELITDEEIQSFLNKRDNFWITIFWIAFIGSILFVGGVGR
jgi:hypothetical protein